MTFDTFENNNVMYIEHGTKCIMLFDEAYIIIFDTQRKYRSEIAINYIGMYGSDYGNRKIFTKLVDDITNWRLNIPNKIIYDLYDVDKKGVATLQDVSSMKTLDSCFRYCRKVFCNIPKIQLEKEA